MKSQASVFTVVMLQAAMICASQGINPEREAKPERLSDECAYIVIYHTDVPGSRPVQYYVSEQEMERLEALHRKCGWSFNESKIISAGVSNFYKDLLAGRLDAWVAEQRRAHIGGMDPRVKPEDEEGKRSI